jgi:hypothetical protein
MTTRRRRSEDNQGVLVCHYDCGVVHSLETKQQSRQWLENGKPGPNKANVCAIDGAGLLQF